MCAKFGLKCIVYMGKKVRIALSSVRWFRSAGPFCAAAAAAAAAAINAAATNAASTAPPLLHCHGLFYKHEKGCCSAKHSCLWSLLFRLTSPFSGLMYGGHFGGHQDMERQQLNVFRMRLLGAEVREVAAGTATLKDATSEAIRDWVTNVETTHYILGSAAGPHPYPMMVRAT